MKYKFKPLTLKQRNCIYYFSKIYFKIFCCQFFEYKIFICISALKSFGSSKSLPPQNAHHWQKTLFSLTQGTTRLWSSHSPARTQPTHSIWSKRPRNYPEAVRRRTKWRTPASSASSASTSQAPRRASRSPPWTRSSSRGKP